MLVVGGLVKHSLQERRIAQEGYSARAKILAVKKDTDSKLNSAFIEYYPQLESSPRRMEIYVNKFKLDRLSPEISEAIGGLENIGKIFTRAREAVRTNAQMKEQGYTKAQIAQSRSERYTSEPLARKARAEELGLSIKWEGLLNPVELPVIVDRSDSSKVVVDYRLLQ